MAHPNMAETDGCYLTTDNQALPLFKPMFYFFLYQ